MPQIGKKVSETAATLAMQMLPSDANPLGKVHGGVVMKHIDEAGGVVAVRHAGGPAVTASIDRLDFHHPVLVGNIIVLKASLNQVGSTSMEVGVRVEAENPATGEVRHTVSAYLTYVALDENSRPREVPPLILETAEDERRNREAKDRRAMRLAERHRERASH